ncbi:hypothetical protein [Luteimonas sp. FCS-9]|uniref:hypothetical protein n=1 Tax=Luteimonas sp. FCS-9 TaxID=1547516 RepID=UPI00069BFB58|nr:hypothetical protein [Luteimonas sp. FCS-9]
MTRAWVPPLAASVAGAALWALASAAAGGVEPWDIASFWTMAYPVALGLSAVLGLVFPVGAWRWGALVVLMLVPVTVVVSGIGPLLAAGVLYAALLAIPAMLLSWLASQLRRRHAARRGGPAPGRR